jgi:hypothetical protein
MRDLDQICNSFKSDVRISLLKPTYNFIKATCFILMCSVSDTISTVLSIANTYFENYYGLRSSKIEVPKRSRYNVFVNPCTNPIMRKTC